MLAGLEFVEPPHEARFIAGGGVGMEDAFGGGVVVALHHRAKERPCLLELLFTQEADEMFRERLQF